MRHKKRRFQLNRFTSWRKATLISLAKNLLIHQSIRTTKVKARAAQQVAEKLITLAKANTLSAKRKAHQILNDHRLVKLLFNDIAGRFNKRQSGFTRLINLGNRRGDNAPMAILELTEIKKKEIKKLKKPKETKEEVAPEVGPKGLPEEKKAKTEAKVLEKPPITKKPTKKFLGGLRNIFKKERDSL